MRLTNPLLILDPLRPVLVILGGRDIKNGHTLKKIGIDLHVNDIMIRQVLAISSALPALQDLQEGRVPF